MADTMPELPTFTPQEAAEHVASHPGEVIMGDKIYRLLDSMPRDVFLPEEYIGQVIDQTNKTEGK